MLNTDARRGALPWRMISWSFGKTGCFGPQGPIDQGILSGLEDLIGQLLGGAQAACLPIGGGRGRSPGGSPAIHIDFLIHYPSGGK
jgi:hypothetical protein